MRKTLFQVVSLLRRQVVNLLRPEVVRLNRCEVVNLPVFSNLITILLILFFVFTLF